MESGERSHSERTTDPTEQARYVTAKRACAFAQQSDNFVPVQLEQLRPRTHLDSEYQRHCVEHTVVCIVH
jgi:hypothetical protein